MEEALDHKVFPAWRSPAAQENYFPEVRPDGTWARVVKQEVGYAEPSVVLDFIAPEYKTLGSPTPSKTAFEVASEMARAMSLGWRPV